MKRKRVSVEQIVAAPRQVELGRTVAEASRQPGVSEQAICRWKKLYGGLQPDQVRDLKLLQEEEVHLKKLVAELSLDKAILRDISARKWPGRSLPGGIWEIPGSPPV